MPPLENKMNTYLTTLRWPEALQLAIQEAARLNRRSMNAEILYRLEASLAAQAPTEERAA